MRSSASCFKPWRGRAATRGVVALALAAAAAVAGGCDGMQAEAQAPPAPEPKLAVTGLFVAGGAWAVQVSHAVAFTDTVRPGRVDSATVEVWSAGERVARLAPVQPGTYVAAGPARPGERFTLRVSAPGYALVEGHDALPHPPVVAARSDTLVKGGPGVPARRRTLRARLVLDDPPPESYYGLQVYQLRVVEDRAAGTTELFDPALVSFRSADDLGGSLLGTAGAGLTRYQTAFFTDDAFDGARRPIRFEVAYDALPPEANPRVYRAYVALLVSGSEDFYRYWTTAVQQLVTGQNPFAEPLRVHSNMNNGLGVFAGFRYRLLPLGGVLQNGRALTARRLCQASEGRRPPRGLLASICETLLPAGNASD